MCLQECLPHIIAALDTHLDEVDIQTKAVVLLGVLIQVTRASSTSTVYTCHQGPQLCLQCLAVVDLCNRALPSVHAPAEIWQRGTMLTAVLRVLLHGEIVAPANGSCKLWATQCASLHTMCCLSLAPLPSAGGRCCA
jgi:hypothetical protein